MVGTTQEIADRLGVDYLTARGLIFFLLKIGKAQKAGSRPAKGNSGKGKPSTVFQLEETVTLEFASEPEAVAV